MKAVEDVGLIPPVVEAFIEQALRLRDEDRRALARARTAVDETFRVRAWKAASEIVAARAEAYFEAWRRIGTAFIPDRLEELVRMGTKSDPAEVAEWQGVARLVRVGMDDALLALLAADSIPPPDVRELYGPWNAMLSASQDRTDTWAARLPDDRSTEPGDPGSRSGPEAQTPG